MPVNGKVQPYDCCALGHTPRLAHEEHDAFSSRLKALLDGCDTPAGKKNLGAFVSAHKRKHR
eukprot:540757-Pleurochrysis_carterae.AAC.1